MFKVWRLIKLHHLFKLGTCGPPITPKSDAWFGIAGQVLGGKALQHAGPTTQSCKAKPSTEDSGSSSSEDGSGIKPMASVGGMSPGQPLIPLLNRLLTCCFDFLSPFPDPQLRTWARWPPNLFPCL